MTLVSEHIESDTRERILAVAGVEQVLDLVDDA